MISFMRNLRRRWMNWVIARAQEDPPIRQQPRALCEHHATGCYLCPREHCIGMLNDRDDPDTNKPKPFTSGHCVYGPSRNGQPGIRFNMTLEGANEYYKRQALDRGYSDIRTTDMVMSDMERADSAPVSPKPEPPPEEKRQARPGDVVW